MSAVPLALASALAFATSTVVQHRAATSLPVTNGRRTVLGLVTHLIRRRAWLAGQATAAAGFALHALALRGGRVVVVQPLLSSGLVLALTLGALVDRCHPDRPLPDRGQWRAAAVVTGGLALFVVTAQPVAGTSTARLTPMLACVIGALVVAGAAALWARRPAAPHRALALGTAAGTGFGVTGLLLKDLVAHPVTHWPSTWSLPALVLVGVVSVLLAQWGYQSGSLIESLPAMTVLEPLVAIGLSGPVFAERLAPGAVAHGAQLLGALALVAGVGLLARRTARRESLPRPRVHRQLPAHASGRPCPAVGLDLTS